MIGSQSVPLATSPKPETSKNSFGLVKINDILFEHIVETHDFRDADNCFFLSDIGSYKIEKFAGPE